MVKFMLKPLFRLQYMKNIREQEYERFLWRRNWRGDNREVNKAESNHQPKPSKTAVQYHYPSQHPAHNPFKHGAWNPRKGPRVPQNIMVKNHSPKLGRARDGSWGSLSWRVLRRRLLIWASWGPQAVPDGKTERWVHILKSNKDINQHFGWFEKDARPKKTNNQCTLSETGLFFVHLRCSAAAPAALAAGCWIPKGVLWIWRSQWKASAYLKTLGWETSFTSFRHENSALNMRLRFKTFI